jgi:hypothetical protein
MQTSTSEPRSIARYSTLPSHWGRRLGYDIRADGTDYGCGRSDASDAIKNLHATRQQVRTPCGAIHTSRETKLGPETPMGTPCGASGPMGRETRLVETEGCVESACGLACASMRLECHAPSSTSVCRSDIAQPTATDVQSPPPSSCEVEGFTPHILHNGRVFGIIGFAFGTR